MSGAGSGHAGRELRGSGVPRPRHTTATDRMPRGGGQISLVILAPVGKSAYTSAPRAVAAGFKVLSHQCLYLVRPQPVQSADLVEAGMIAKRHLDDFAKCRRVKEMTFHRWRGVFAASQVKLAVQMGPFMQHDIGLDTRRSGAVQFCYRCTPTGGTVGLHSHEAISMGRVQVRVPFLWSMAFDATWIWFCQQHPIGLSLSYHWKTRCNAVSICCHRSTSHLSSSICI